MHGIGQCVYIYIQQAVSQDEKREIFNQNENKIDTDKLNQCLSEQK